MCHKLLKLLGTHLTELDPCHQHSKLLGALSYMFCVLQLEGGGAGGPLFMPYSHRVYGTDYILNNG